MLWNHFELTANEDVCFTINVGVLGHGSFQCFKESDLLSALYVRSTEAGRWLSEVQNTLGQQHRASSDLFTGPLGDSLFPLSVVRGN